ncbi:hypothetical protein [Bradyrhizobium sp. AZCC 2289]|uniref:hypothetical protein n=1 Tax=Bradyrhizobium sp. AZCC 2289 TaxID=3117026 RepID=UPI002FEF3D31
MLVGHAIRRFETRAFWLTTQAWFFLFFVLVLLVAGAAAVWFAPTITAGDIGAVTNQKFEAIQQAQFKDVARLKELRNVPMRKACNDEMVAAFKGWLQLADSGPFQILHPTADGHIVSGDEIVAAVQQHEVLIVDPGECATYATPGMFRIFVPKDRFEEFKKQMAGKKFGKPELAANIAEINKINARDAQLDELHKQVELERLQSEVAATGDKGAGPAPERSLFLSLLQTSVTRFGLLAVIGFFVSILVSMYRYNIRLAAFYVARADALRLFAPDITISDFALVAAALSPTVEFGKAPQPPLAQLVDLIKSAKEAAK